MITIADIAERTGASIAAVSLALNGKPGVGPELRDRIVAEADRLGYRRLRRRSRVIRILHVSKHGRILNAHHKSFIADYLDGLQFEASRSGLVVDLRFLEGLTPATLQAAVEPAGAEGLVILGTELDRADVEELARLEAPKIFIDAYYPDLDLDFVDMDNARALYDITDHLWGLGHRDFGIVVGKIATPNFRLRELAFFEALAARAPAAAVRPDRVVPRPAPAPRRFAVDPSYEGAYEDMRALLAKNRPLPTALVCVNDIIALGAMKALKEAGRDVPGEISVVGFDNIELGALAEPGLTSYEVSKREIGRRALKLLLERLEDKEFRHSEK
ncbi:MAG: LacI family DNA-binding transcriptional regulator, partial [Spirochaetaceae bacterium]|nr:LacI family DNA-binding transcriptional regulator [Spirochaetaceae bacterium]